MNWYSRKEEWWMKNWGKSTKRNFRSDWKGGISVIKLVTWRRRRSWVLRQQFHAIISVQSFVLVACFKELTDVSVCKSVCKSVCLCEYVCICECKENKQSECLRIWAMNLTLELPSINLNKNQIWKNMKEDEINCWRNPFNFNDDWDWKDRKIRKGK